MLKIKNAEIQLIIKLKTTSKTKADENMYKNILRYLLKLVLTGKFLIHFRIPSILCR